MDFEAGSRRVEKGEDGYRLTRGKKARDAEVEYGIWQKEEWMGMREKWMECVGGEGENGGRWMVGGG